MKPNHPHHRPSASDPARLAGPGILGPLLLLTLLAACSNGGDSSDPPPPSATQLTGTAAVGLPLAGASIRVIDADGTTADPAPVVAGVDGRYTVNVTGLKAPLLVRASGGSLGGTMVQWAVVPALTVGASNPANVTPLTSAVAALVAPAGDPAALATAATLAANATAARVGNAATLVVNTLRSDSQTAALLGAGFSPLSTPFTANGEGIDRALDRLKVSWSASGVTLVNQAAALAGDGLPPSVTLTAAQTATPDTAPALPASTASNNLPGAAELAVLGARIEACLALPVASRVTLDASGTVTAVSAACNLAPTDWRSNGRNWMQELGQFVFAKNLLGNAKVGRGVVEQALAAEGRSGANEFKHPYCNDAPCVLVRFPLTTAGGRIVNQEWMLGRVAGQWNFVGNQRPFRAVVQPRLYRKINTNRNGPAAGSSVNPYFLLDRYESALRVTFDLSVGDTADVRAVRVSGPGLPAAGLVMSRSQSCGTVDRMGITQQSGSTRLTGSSVFQYWTTSTSADLFIDAANLDGSALAMPVPTVSGSSASFQNFAPAPVADPARTIPAGSTYKWEVFRYSTLSDAPDLVFYTRSIAPAERAADGAAKDWPELLPSMVSSLLVPGGSAAASLSGLSHSVDWSSPPGSFVSSAYLFGSNAASATNSQGESASYGLRTLLSMEPAAYGDARATGWRYGDVASGTSLSPHTESLGSNPNPRCDGRGNEVLELTSSFSDYREVGLFLTDAQNRAQSAVWFWDN